MKNGKRLKLVAFSVGIDEEKSQIMMLAITFCKWPLGGESRNNISVYILDYGFVGDVLVYLYIYILIESGSCQEPQW